MARIRTIKPEFWTDERVGECSPSARLLFIASWNFADDRGGIERSAKQLKAQAFPYDTIDCEPLVQQLLNAGLFIEYEVAGKMYLHIKGFLVHQKIDNPARPRIPPYEESANNTEKQSTPPLVLTEPSRSKGRESKGMEGKGERGGSHARPARPPPRKRCPIEFQITPDLRTWAKAQAPDVDVDRETERFRDWEFKTGRSDWPAAWRTWMRRAQDSLANRPSGNRAPQREAIGETIARLHREADEAGEARL